MFLHFKSFPESPFGGYQPGHGRAARLQNSVWILCILWFCESCETAQVQHVVFTDSCSFPLP